MANESVRQPLAPHELKALAIELAAALPPADPTQSSTRASFGEMVTLPAAHVADIRRMLLVGLSSLAEIERIDNALAVAGSNPPIPKEFRPMHPTGALEHADFAQALMWLEFAQPVQS